MILLIEGNEFIGDPPAPAKTWGEYFENVFVTSLLSGLRVSALAEDVPETNFGNMAQAVDLKRDDIIRLARDVCETADPIIDDESDLAVFRLDELERFAALVAAAEREACAQVCESLFDADDDSCNEAEKCAAAIRARGNQ